MIQLKHKRILLGITGGIAAYKSAELTRALKTAGADVRVVMTPAAQEFITPLTLQALSGREVHTEMLDHKAEAGMGHIELAKWADAILIAPASADFIARLAAGQGNDLLSTLCLATDAPLYLAPAMNQAMWHQAATQDNLATLKGRNVTLFGPGAGQQACGDVGLGRMLEPVELANMLAATFAKGQLSGTRLVITAGPTREALDPVRYITNHSSGKMGYALAQAAIEQGADVTLISGPTQLEPPERCTFVSVTSAQQMYDAALSTLGQCDLFIGTAAVADYRAADIAEHKLKKGSDDELTLRLVKNPDIVASVAQHAQRPFTVGFAAETQNIEAYAQSKLERKNLDLIIANDVSDTRIGFNSDQNAVTVISATCQTPLPMASKSRLATQLIQTITDAYQQAKSTS